MFAVVRLSDADSVRVPFDADDTVEAFLTRLRGLARVAEHSDLVVAADGSRLPAQHSLKELGVATAGQVFSLRTKVTGAAQLTDRQKLAAAFHVAVMHGWDQLIYNHFTCRASESSFLVHPFGLLYEEVSASSLLEVSLATGEIMAGPAASVDMPYNATAYVIHSCIYKARPDVQAVLHCHEPAVVAVASSAERLLVGLSQESSLLGPLAYHPYEGISVSDDEQERLVAHLGPRVNILMLENHGVIVCGCSVAHALHLLYHLVRACRIQLKTLAASARPPIMPPAAAVESAFATHSSFSVAGNHNLEFDAMLRRLGRQQANPVYLQ